MGSFSTKVIALIIAIVWISQLATFISVNSSTDRNVRQKLEDDLITASKIYNNIVETKNTQLLSSVEVLTSDFGFKETIATGDEATIESVILNHGNRIGADLVKVLTLEGEFIASTESRSDDKHKLVDLSEQLKIAEEEGFLLEPVMTNNELYQSVIVPVLAPAPIAWVFIGFKINDAEAESFKRLIGHDVTFTVIKDGALNIVASTLDNDIRNKMIEEIRVSSDGRILNETIILDGNDYLTSLLSLSDTDNKTSVLLQHSLNSALEPYKPLKKEILTLSLIASIVALIFSIYIGRSVTRPVKKLALAAKRIIDGDYEAKIEVQSNDEIGRLATTFNHMQAGISEREKRIMRHAHYDELTGLVNPVLMNDRITTAKQRSDRTNKHFSLILISLRRFKDINNAFGHKMGDSVLKEISRRIISHVRATDTVARVSGDEFLILLDGANELQSINFTENLIVKLKDSIEFDSASIIASLCTGIVCYPDHGKDAAELIRRADIAMSEAKENFTEIGIYESGRDEGHIRQLSIVRDLKKAVQNEQFHLNFQPKVDARSGNVVGVEVLIRWIHPELGFMPPDEFIPIAEQSGNVPLITSWVLKKAIEQCKKWNDLGLKLKTSINLSAVDLLNPDLPAQIIKYLNVNNVKPSQLVLEITESAVVRDTKLALTLLNQLKSTGISLSIDDYGTGFSSLAKLKQLPVQELKIDKSFVLNLTEDSDDAVIVQSTIDLGHNMGLRVTAEGVENNDTLELLKKYGCDDLQGYYISRPLNEDDFFNWVQEYSQKSDLENSEPEALGTY